MRTRHALTRRQRPARLTHTDRVRMTDFWERMAELLGPAHAESFARYQVLTGLDGRTVEEALAAGEPAKEVWRVVVESVDAPADVRRRHR
jgi:hypothetical protein